MPELRNSQVSKDESDSVDPALENNAKSVADESFCGHCKSIVLPTDKALSCEVCSTWWHITCVDVTATKYKFLMNNTDIFWFCPNCSHSAKKLYQEMILLKTENAHIKEELEAVKSEFKAELKKERTERIIMVDRLEQYQRKDSLRINGIPHHQGESNIELEDKVIALADKINVKLNRSDISVTHRLKPTLKGIHPVIIKFSTRRAKDAVYYNKKRLKDVDGMDSVFISEDLTRLRYRTLILAKKAKNLNSITTRGGKIKVYVGESRIPITVESPMDLAKLDIEPDLKFLGLPE